MNKYEFKKEAKKLGYSDEEIKEIIAEYDEEIKIGINPIPLENMLVEKPIDY